MSHRVNPIDIEQPEELIALIAETRDREAFTILFAQFAPVIKAYLRRGGCVDGEAEELTQETMLAVWRKAHQFDPERATAAAWIYAIARNRRLDGLRRKPWSSFPIEPERDPPPQPDEVFFDRQAIVRLEAAIANLPAGQIQIVRAAYIEHRSHAEIAEALSLPLGTVKSRLRLALQKLRNEMEPLR